MKSLLITDCHGRDPTKVIEREVKESGIQKLVMLGDLDTPEVLRALQDVSQKHNLKFLYTPGNHENHYVRHFGISGEYMRIQERGKWVPRSAGEYFGSWDASPKEKKFVLRAIDEVVENADLILKETIGERTIAYAHASLVDMGSPDSDVLGFVWARLIDPDTKMYYNVNILKANFEKMIEDRISLFFRGHDHKQLITSETKDNYIASPPALWAPYYLNTGSPQIVTVGAFIEDFYAIFNEERMEIEFRLKDAKTRSTK